MIVCKYPLGMRTTNVSFAFQSEIASQNIYSQMQIIIWPQFDTYKTYGQCAKGTTHFQ
jgi:hypothetical protein